MGIYKMLNLKSSSVSLFKKRRASDELVQILSEESLNLVERDNVQLVIQVGMAGTGDDAQLLIVAGELFIDTLAEITGVRLFSMHQ